MAQGEIDPVQRSISGKILHGKQVWISFRGAFDLIFFSQIDTLGKRNLSSGSYGLVAQSVEQRPFKPLVPGSSPGQPTTSPNLNLL